MNAKNDRPTTGSNLEAENKELQRKIKQLERDNRMLAVMTRNSEQLRNSFEAEKKLQYLYNDLLLVNCPNMIFLFNEQLRLVFCSRAMGGDIWVESEYGKGSTFTFRVPQKVVDNRPIAQVKDSAAKKVLLLGDDKRRNYVADLLTSLDVSFVTPMTGELPDNDALAGYTHCVFDESWPAKEIRALRSEMPCCRFGALQDMRHAMALSDYHDSILYLPLFITDLAAFLNKAGRAREIVVGIESSGADIVVKDVRLLVVDDNEINLVVSSEMLRSFEAEVECAESGDEAITLCRENKYDLIFMDHMMPGKDGIQTTAEIRAGRGPNRKTPIVALTANVVNDMQSYYLRCGLDDFIAKPVEMAGLGHMLLKWLPAEKIIRQETVCVAPQADDRMEDFGFKNDRVTPEELIAAMDNFGLYSSDVMRELNGNFEGYVVRMQDAAQILCDLTDGLKVEVAEEKWDDFSKDVLTLSSLLHGIGARDCAARARKLALAARARNVPYIRDDFFSLMGNMYMLDKKLVAIVPLARSGNLKEIPMNVPQALHGSLEKLGRALKKADAVEAMVQLANTATISLDMDLDMALKAIKLDLEKGDFNAAAAKHAEIFKSYTERLAAFEEARACA